jgi:hypothetical protein
MHLRFDGRGFGVFKQPGFSTVQNSQNSQTLILYTASFHKTSIGGMRSIWKNDLLPLKNRLIDCSS